MQASTGKLGIHSLDHFSMSVPDLAQAQSFYDAFGLKAQAQGSQLALHTFPESHRWGVLVEGGKKQLQYLSFGAYAEDLPRFRERLKQRGIELLAPPAGSDGQGLWFRNPDGLLIEIRAAEKSSPDARSVFGTEDAYTPLRGTMSRSQAPRVYPRRLSHVAIFTPDVSRSIAFYADVLGMRLSDRSADIVAFMHGVHGSDHHLVALVKSGGPGFHHCSWDVGTVQDVGVGALQMLVRGHAAGWGLGRHVLGSNYFHYVRDPWGSYSEYSAGMDYIPAELEWEGSDQPPEDAMFLWGPNPPEEFVHNAEAGA